MKVCVVIPYFGRWPQLLPLFLESCRRNPKLDVLIVTDNDPPEGAPDNVRFITTGFGEIRDRFFRSLGFEVALPGPYKLCDFKPAYGFLFEEELRGYNFWGHGDRGVCLPTRFTIGVLVATEQGSVHTSVGPVEVVEPWIDERLAVALLATGFRRKVVDQLD